MTLLTAIIIVTVTGVLGAVILALASQFMRVETDPRIAQIEDVLPSVNCGACGYAGCSDYAGSIVENDEKTNLCVPGGDATAARVADIMGTHAGHVAAYKAIVACQGTVDHITKKYRYAGVATCRASNALYGGASSCPYGCLGFGDCALVCRFGAIEIQNGVARVNPAKCTGCGACKDACPKRVIWIREVSEKPVVMCANHQRGNMTAKACTAGCIGCMKCERTCPERAIKVTDNVARINLAKCVGCRACVNICPVKAIAVPKVI